MINLNLKTSLNYLKKSNSYVFYSVKHNSISKDKVKSLFESFFKLTGIKVNSLVVKRKGRGSKTLKKFFVYLKGDSFNMYV
jgi:ribosomal protein L23